MAFGKKYDYYLNGNILLKGDFKILFRILHDASPKHFFFQSGEHIIWAHFDLKKYDLFNNIIEAGAI